MIRVYYQQQRGGVDYPQPPTPPATVESAQHEKTSAQHQTPSVTFLTGPRRGQTVGLDELQVEKADGKFRRVSPKELSRMHDVVAARLLDSKVVQTANQPVQGEQVPAKPLPPPRPVALDQQSLPSGIAAPGPNSAQQAQEGAAPGADKTKQAQDGDGSSNSDGGNNSSETSSTSSLTMPTPTSTLPDNTKLTGLDMDVVYLPDLDEQYVIKSKNLVSKSAFSLAFKNGSELVEVQGEHDSTVLAVSILQQIQNAISAATGAAQQQNQQQSKSSSSNQGSTTGKGASHLVRDLTSPTNTKRPEIYQLKETTVIQPGVYRLNKPWEIADGPGAPPVGCGLLARIGLPITTSIDITWNGWVSN
jgi:hypothetical protein